MASFGGANWRRTPVTWGILASLVLAAFIFWAAQDRGIEAFLLTGDAFREPWRLLTFTWAFSPLGGGLSLLFFALLCYWIYSISPSLEAEIGSLRFAGVWFGACALVGLAVSLGMMVTGASAAMGGPWLAASALTVLWAARNQTATLMLYGLIPVSGRVLAIITVISDILLAGASSPVAGVISALPLGFWWAFGNDQIPFLPFNGVRKLTLTDQPVMRGIKVYDDQYYEDVRKREQERDERERLRRLLEGPP
jgi:hypothetical protein